MKRSKLYRCISRRTFLKGAALAGSLSTFVGCSLQKAENGQSKQDSRNPHQYDSLLLDMSQWEYDDDHDVYYVLDIPYCQNPVSKEYQTISLYVPGVYFSSEKKGDYYTCELHNNVSLGSFKTGELTCLFPINCANYGSQKAQTSYSYDGLEPYLSTGFIYAMAGCRSRSQGFDATNAGNGLYDGGIPATVCDLKAALRFLRLNAKELGIKNICALGVGQGGYLATLLGVSGNAEFFSPLLDNLGAASWNQDLESMGDQLDGVCAWTPELSLAKQDSAYEWQYGQYMSDSSRQTTIWTSSLSNDLANAWAAELTEQNIPLSSGEKASLEATSSGVFADGSFYRALKEEAEHAAEAFFSFTSFPVSLESVSQEKAPFPADAKDTIEEDLEAKAQDAAAAIDSESLGKTDTEQKGTGLSTITYKTAQAYVNRLNKNTVWLNHTPQTSMVQINSLRDLVLQYAKPMLSCTAFDGLDAKTIQNQLFGVNNSDSLHFSRLIADLLTANMSIYSSKEEWSDVYTLSWATDLEKEDSAGNTVSARADAADQFAYIQQESPSGIAGYWRLHAGIQQGNIPWAPIFVLSKMLNQHQDVIDVDYETIWHGGINLCENGSEGIEKALLWLENKLGSKE